MAGSVKPWGYRTGGIQQVEFKVADAATDGIAVGDFVIMEGSNAGYIVPCSAGDKPVGVAMSACGAPSATRRRPRRRSSRRRRTARSCIG